MRALLSQGPILHLREQLSNWRKEKRDRNHWTSNRSRLTYRGYFDFLGIEFDIVPSLHIPLCLRSPTCTLASDPSELLILRQVRGGKSRVYLLHELRIERRHH